MDKFYTKKDVSNYLMEIVKKILNIKDDLIIESSAGDGSFIDGIKKITSNYLFYDILPENDEIIRKDYLTLDINEIKKNERIYVIGNPPFGRQSSLLIKFIKKSCEFCDGFGFILPKSFKKDTLKNKVPLNYHLIYEEDLNKNSFLLDGKDYDVPCVFQIWIRRDYERIRPEILNSIDYKFVKRNEEPDISIRRVGVNAGFISFDIKEINEKNIQTHYFIKINKNKEDIIKKLKENNINYEFNNSVGPKSLSKQEIIKYFKDINVF